jgi:Myb-like DNA-binding domain
MSNPLRKWKDSKDKNLVQGKWTDKEIKHLKKLLCKYAARKNLSTEQLGELCSDTTPSQFRHIWTKLAKFFPNRSVQSVHNCCKRNFNPFNYKGDWTVQEEKTLIEYVEANGNKWKELGDLLQRTALNVKDKWKQMGGENNRLRKTGVWSLEETLVLSMLVFQNLSLPCNDIEKLSMNNEDKTMANLLDIIKSYTKVFKKSEINWETISQIFKTRSSVDCRNRWSYIIDYKVPDRMTFTNQDDVEIFKSIKKQNVDCTEDIDFGVICNGKSEDDNKFRFKVLSKAMSGRLRLSLKEILEKLEYSYGTYEDTKPVEESILEYYNSNYKKND